MANDTLLLERHLGELVRYAITPKVLELAGVRSIERPDQLPEEADDYWKDRLPAKLYPWSMNGHQEWQLAPDDRTTGPKYLFRHGSEPPLNCFRDTGEGPILLVEGTKQHLSAASYAPSEFAIYGMFGCWGWSKSNLSFAEGRSVWVVLDGDFKTNRDVYDAAKQLGEALALVDAEHVLFVKIPGDDGLDDYLAQFNEETRTQRLGRLLERADEKLGRAPAKKQDNPHGVFFSESGSLLAMDVAKVMFDHYPMALTRENLVALYLDGAYRIDPGVFMGMLVKLLLNDYRPIYRATVEEVTSGILTIEGRRLPDRLTQPIMNVRNGLVDLRTGEMMPHTPDLLTALQLPVDFDPDATCPTYEAWADQIIGEQLDDLEEAASAMLDPSQTPTKALFLYGPSRSGKSTFLRLLTSLAGNENTSGVTLQQLSDDDFSAANVYGKILNVAADLSARHVEDLSTFKLMTGEDLIRGNRKYGKQFFFVNTSLFAFSANEIPSVGENSRAYAERIKPFKFGHSYAGREDHTIELRMLEEMPGILNRLVIAYRRRQERGAALPTIPGVRQEFEAASDRVQQWLDEEMTIVREHEGVAVREGALLPVALCTTATALADVFNRWADANHIGGMGRNNLVKRLTSKDGIVNVRQAQTKARAINIIKDRSGNSSVAEVADVPQKAPRPGYNAPIQTVHEGQVSTHPSGETLRAKVPQVPPPATGQGEESWTTPSTMSIKTSSMNTPEPTVSDEVTVKPAIVTSGPVVRPILGPVPSANEGSSPATRSSNDEALASGLTSGATPITERDPDQIQVKEENQDMDPIIYFDLETTGVERQWSDPPGSHVRLAGWAVGEHQVQLTVDPSFGASILEGAGTLVGHNILGYDLPVLTRHHDFPSPWTLLNVQIKALHDTQLMESLIDPPSARLTAAEANRYYKLENVATRYGIAGKAGDLVKMAKHYGGFDRIPLDNPDFLTYLRQDVALTRKVFQLQQHQIQDMDPIQVQYLEREHEVAALAAQISLNGFRIDQDLVAARVQEGQAKRARLLEQLHDQYGLPRTTAGGKPAKSPQATKDGKLAIATAFADAGVPLEEFKEKPTSGAPDLSKDYMDQLMEQYQDLPKVVELAELVQDLNGVRPIYETISQYKVKDPIQNQDLWRVHPSISLRQASGRWSVTKPGLTVVGKRGGRVREREVFLAEPGHVIVAVDLAQVDARAVAAHCQDPAYIAMFEPGKDSHTEVAIRVWGDPSRRQDAKVIGHGANYGMGAKKLALSAGVPLIEAEHYLRSMREEFPRLIEWQMEVRDIGTAGQLLDNGFGRKLRVDPDRSWTQAPALMGQGTARDLMMEGLLRLARSHPETLDMLRLQVHDEIVLSVPEDQAHDVAETVTDALTFEWAPPGASIPVKITAEASIGSRTWASAYEK